MKPAFRDKYPHAFEDAQGTIWTSREACDAADWTYANGDAFLDEVLGWSWAEAEENFALKLCEDRRKAFWRTHPHIRDVCRFVRCWYGALSLFSRTVWRDYYGRISWKTAWEIASGIWLDRLRRSKG